MIKIIKGTYGLREGDEIRAVTPGSEPITLKAEREKELVEMGVAEYVEQPENEPKPAAKAKAKGTQKKVDAK